MNNKGEVQLIFLLLISSTLLVVFLYFQFALISLTNMQKRLNSYLCYRSYQKELRSLTTTLTKLNLTMAPLVPMSFVPSTAKTARLMIKNLQMVQDVKLKFFQNHLLQNKYCHPSLKGILMRSHPYLTNGNSKLYRDQTALAKIGKNEWTLNLFGKKSLKPIIYLKLKHNSALSSKTQINARELENLAAAP